MEFDINCQLCVRIIHVTPIFYIYGFVSLRNLNDEQLGKGLQYPGHLKLIKIYSIDALLHETKESGRKKSHSAPQTEILIVKSS